LIHAFPLPTPRSGSEGPLPQPVMAPSDNCPEGSPAMGDCGTRLR